MSTAITKTQKDLKQMVQSETVQERLHQCLGKRANQFATSLLALVGNDRLLADAEPQSILQSAMTAATLDLPIQKDLGFAWIIGYKDNSAGSTVAQFQMGYKGFIQLALRSGQYAGMNDVVVTDGAYGGTDALGEPIIHWDRIDPANDAIGYAFAFRLVNGFSKCVYWSKEKVQAHAKRFSQSYRSGRGGPWVTDFDQMAMKTVIKSALSKWGILSVEMQTAIIEDQKADGAYIDNDPTAAATDRVADKLRAKLAEHAEKTVQAELLDDAKSK